MAWLGCIFDRIFLDPFFFKKERSDVIFYPFTRMWNGYELPLHREADVRSALRLQVVASIIVVLWFAFIVSKMALGDSAQRWFDWLGLFLWFAFLALVTIYSRFSLVRDLTSANPATRERERESPKNVHSDKH